MGALIACWLVFPLVFGVLAYGCGSLIECLSGSRLRLGVRLACGTALMIAVLELASRSRMTIMLATPVVLGIAVIGVWLRRPWRARGLDTTALLVAVVVFGVYAAPIVFSGMATWAGYVKLDDTATWLALVDRALTAGHTLAGLAPSTYRDTLAAYLTNGYPVGSFLPIGLGGILTGQDIAWLVDPWMAFLAAMLALCMYEIGSRALADRGVAARWQAAIVAIVAAQSALLYGYYLWGGIKEVAGAMLVAAFAATLPIALATVSPAVEQDKRLLARSRAFIPALVVVWALLASLSSGGLVWVFPGGLLVLVALWLRGRVRVGLWSDTGGLRSISIGLTANVLDRQAFWVVPAVAVPLALVAYLVLRPGGFLAQNMTTLTGGRELGNLFKPLHIEQIAGVWPAGDFRLTPSHATIAILLIVLAVLFAAGGVAFAWRSVSRELLVYVACALSGALLIHRLASPWVAGKALASASPVVLLLALYGCMVLSTHAAWVGRRRRALSALGILSGVTIATGVVWSNALAYRDASLAPRAQFVALAKIGERIAGQGPTLMSEYSPFGARHFLREAETESASDLRSRPDLLRSGRELTKGASADIDQFQLQDVLAYRTLVLRRSPVESRPPSPYTLILKDKYWEVWQRPQVFSPPVLAHMSLGDATLPGAVPSCPSVLTLARTPGVARLLGGPVEDPLVIGAGEGTHPARWADGSEYLTLRGSGTARVLVHVPSAGRYEVWLGGSIPGALTIAINGHTIGAARYETQEGPAYVPFGIAGLEHGLYAVTISHSGTDWRPGSGGAPMTVGPLVLARQTGERQMLSFTPKNARALCGRTLDWVEAVGA